MKGFAMFVAAMVCAALIYATSATGTQQTGPTRAEFNALKRQVAALKTKLTVDEKTLSGVKTLVELCLVTAVPIGRYSGFINQRPDGAVVRANALDVVDAFSGGSPQMYALDVGQSCALVLNATPPLRPQGYAH